MYIYWCVVNVFLCSSFNVICCSCISVLGQAVQISQASPAWQDYVDYVDTIVLDGLKQACLASLKSMYNQVCCGNPGSLTSIQEIRGEETTETTEPQEVCSPHNFLL